MYKQLSQIASRKSSYPYFCERWLVFFLHIYRGRVSIIYYYYSHYRETRRHYSTYIRSLLVSVLQYPLHFTFASRQPSCCMTFRAYNGRKLIHMYSPMRESLKENRKSLLLSKQENPGTAGVSNGNCGENNSCLNISEIKKIYSKIKMSAILLH